VTGPLVEGPLDGDHAVGLGGDGSESTDGEVERVGVVAGGADVLDLGGDGLSVVGVLDGHPLAAKVGLLAEVGPPSLVDGDEGGRVRVVVTASTGVAVLVEEGSVTAGLDVAGETAVVGGGLGSLGGGLGGRGGGRGDPLGSGGGGGGLGGQGSGGRRGLGGVVGLGGDVGRGSDRGGRSGGLVSRGGRVLGSVGRAVLRSVGKGLGGEQRSAALGEEGGVVLRVAVEGEVPGVVWSSQGLSLLAERLLLLTGVVVLEVAVSPALGRGGDGGGKGRGGGEGEEDGSVHG